MSDTLCIIDKIRPILDEAVRLSLAGDDEIFWDAGHVVVPGPQGAMVQGVVSLMCKSPLLNTPPLVATASIPSLMLVMDQDIANDLVNRLAENIRQARSAMLSASIERPPMPDLSGFGQN